MAASLRRDRISAVDTAWLRMDRPHNLMMICGVLELERRVKIARLRAVIEERFLLFRRFRQKAVLRPALAMWETDANFDIDRHVIEVKLPGRAGKRELQQLVSELAATPLAPDRPMWQFHLVSNHGSRSAVIVRIHHSYADGMALVRVMLSMTDTVKGIPAMPFHPRTRKRAVQDDSILSPFFEPMGGAMKAAGTIASKLLEQGTGIWRDPGKAAELMSQGGALTAEAAHLAFMQSDSPTRFKGHPAVSKRVAWAEPLPLDEVKTVGRALSASVNDVLLSCVAGAIRDYLAAKGDPTEGVMLRALIPVNLRPPEEAWRLGNRFGLVFLELPIGTANPVARLYQVRASMNQLKGSYQPILAMGILAAMGAGPRALQEVLLHTLARNASAVMTNVPGPQQPLYIAGARIDDIMFWVPQSGDIGVGVSIISYAGKVMFGLIVDEGMCPDPEAIVARFRPQFEQLVYATLMAWPRDGDLDAAVVERVAGSV